MVHRQSNGHMPGVPLDKRGKKADGRSNVVAYRLHLNLDVSPENYELIGKIRVTRNILNKSRGGKEQEPISITHILDEALELDGATLGKGLRKILSKYDEGQVDAALKAHVEKKREEAKTTLSEMSRAEAKEFLEDIFGE